MTIADTFIALRWEIIKSKSIVWMLFFLGILKNKANVVERQFASEAWIGHLDNYNYNWKVFVSGKTQFKKWVQCNADILLFYFTVSVGTKTLFSYICLIILQQFSSTHTHRSYKKHNFLNEKRHSAAHRASHSNTIGLFNSIWEREVQKLSWILHQTHNRVDMNHTLGWAIWKKYYIMTLDVITIYNTYHYILTETNCASSATFLNAMESLVQCFLFSISYSCTCEQARGDSGRKIPVWAGGRTLERNQDEKQLVLRQFTQRLRDM